MLRVNSAYRLAGEGLRTRSSTPALSSRHLRTSGNTVVAFCTHRSPTPVRKSILLPFEHGFSSSPVLCRPQESHTCCSIMSHQNEPAIAIGDAVTVQRFAHETSMHHGDLKPKGTVLQTLYGCLTYVPPRCRYDPDKPFEFSMGLNLLFGKRRTAHWEQ